MPKAQNFQPYQFKRAYLEISQEIKQAILDRSFQPGERLPSERSLAQQFNVGRFTIREALRTLETKGLITIKHGRGGGAFIGVPDPETFPSMITDNLQLEGINNGQLIDARIGLECAIIEYVIKYATIKDLDRIEQNVEKSREIIKPENAHKKVTEMIGFHILLGEATHNLPFSIFIRTLMEWARRMLISWVPTEEEQTYSYDAHKGILESVKKKDTHLARNLMKDHVVQITEYIIGDR